MLLDALFTHYSELKVCAQACGLVGWRDEFKILIFVGDKLILSGLTSKTENIGVIGNLSVIMWTYQLKHIWK